MRGGDADRGADEHRREDGPAAEARERQRVGEALADHEQQQGADRPLRRRSSPGPGASTAPRRGPRRRLVRGLPEHDGKARDEHADDGHERHHPPLDVGAHRERQPLDGAPRNAAPTPNTIAHRNIAPVGWPKGGSPEIASENVPKPVRESRPTKTSIPIPAASSPGTSTSPSIGPPMPDASRSRNAPSNGEPSSELMAAKLPAAAMTVVAVGGASRAARRTASTPSPLPMRISGASGPRTTPKLNVPSEASRMPGRSIGRRRPPRETRRRASARRCRAGA